MTTDAIVFLKIPTFTYPKMYWYTNSIREIDSHRYKMANHNFWQNQDSILYSEVGKWWLYCCCPLLKRMWPLEKSVQVFSVMVRLCINILRCWFLTTWALNEYHGTLERYRAIFFGQCSSDDKSRTKLLTDMQFTT